jgi:hypothetical protein
VGKNSGGIRNRLFSIHIYGKIGAEEDSHTQHNCLISKPYVSRGLA